MFDKLRRQFIITTMLIVSAVLVVSFTAIYLSAANSFDRNIAGPPPFEPGGPRFMQLGSETRSLFDERFQEVAARSLNELLINLIVAGIVILIVVYFVSRFVAGRAVGVIEKAYEKQRQFIADASHELKTPIAIIGTNVEAAISDTKKPSKWLNNIKSEAERMGRLVNDLLQLARLDAHTEGGTTNNTFNVSAMLGDIADCFSPFAAKKDVVIVRKFASPLKITCDEDKLKQLLTILVDNAVKYTKSGGKVTLASTKKGGTVTLSVANTHPRVRPAELDRFFDRFYQADPSHRTAGHGLGLSIAKDTAAELHASLYATSHKGTITFSLELPA